MSQLSVFRVLYTLYSLYISMYEYFGISLKNFLSKQNILIFTFIRNFIKINSITSGTLKFMRCKTKLCHWHTYVLLLGINCKHYGIIKRLGVYRIVNTYTSLLQRWPWRRGTLNYCCVLKSANIHVQLCSIYNINNLVAYLNKKSITILHLSCSREKCIK